MELKKRLLDILDKNKDHIIIFSLVSGKFVNRIDLGTSKNDLDGDSIFV
ncbi:MAG: hypothetical protein QXU18_04240 [Thermoplasmatales archaeon]